MMHISSNTSKIYFLTFITAISFMFYVGFGHAETERQGTIVETMDAASYTYLKINTATQQVWVAIPATTVKVGEEVTYLQGMVMADFHSKTLDKTFESIIFSPGLEDGDKKKVQPTPAPQKTSSSFAEAIKNETKKPATPPLNSANTSGSAGAMVPFIEAKVEKASGENSYTIEEIFDKADTLDGQNVRLRGKVVKISPNIMGRNWIHVQDGTGDPMKNSHDLVITSTELVEVNQVILIEGVMVANKDFGFGYKYTAMIEQAALSTE